MTKRRINGSYVNARSNSLAPEALEGLKPRLPYLRKLIRQHFPPDFNASILDLGCGHGALMHVTRQMGYQNIRGVDRSVEQVAAAKRLGIQGVEQGDAMETLAGRSDASLDCVIAFDLIEHFTRGELIPFLDAVLCTLKLDGRLIPHTPNGESPFRMRMRYWDLTHELAFTRTSLSQLLFSSGFSQVNCFEDCPVPHGMKSAGRWVLSKVFRNLLRLYVAAETGDFGRDAVFSQNLLCVAFK